MLTATVDARSSLSFIAALMLFATAAADDSSHRVISTPQLDGVDITKQMEMLRRLQSLASRLESPDSSSEKLEKLPGNVTSEDLDKLRELYNRIGANPPGRRQFQPPDSFPGGSQSDRKQQPSDVENSQLLEDLMQRLSGKIPQIDNATNDESTREAGQNARASSGVSMRSRRDPLFRRLPQRSDSGESSERSLNETGDSAARRTNSSSSSKSPGQLGELTVDQIDKMFRRSEASPVGTNPEQSSPSVNRSQQNSPQIGNLDLNKLREHAEGMRSQIRRPSDSDVQNDSSSQSATPDWLDALKQLDQSTSDSSSRQGERTSPDKSQRRGTDAKLDDDSRLSDLAKSLGGSQSIRDFKKNLRKTVLEAKKQAREQTHVESVSEQPGGFDWSTLAGAQSAIEASAKSLAKSLNANPDRQPTRNAEPKKRPQSESKSSSTAKSIRNAFSPVKDFAKSANTMIMSGPNSSRSESNSSSSGLPSVQTPQFGWLLKLLFIVAISAFGYFLFLRTQRRKSSKHQEVLRQMAFKLRSRKDVISAFHRVTSLSHVVQGNWWTHQRAASAMASEDPRKSTTLETLARLYERARYLPPDVEFSREELEFARKAIKKCIVA